MSKPMDSGETAKLTEQELRKSIIEVIKQIKENINCEPHKEITAFIGATKSGKSTFINCLLGNELRINIDEYEDHILEQVDTKAGPTIGLGLESETYEPAEYGPLYKTDWHMWDFPGFGDNKGVEREVANAINIQNILRQAKSVRFALVVPYDDIKTANPFLFYCLLNNLLTITPKIADSLCIIGTKGERDNFEKILTKLSKTQMQGLSDKNSEIVSSAQNILKQVLQNRTFYNFKAPTGNEGAIFVLSEEALDEITETFKRCSPARLANCRISVSDRAKLFFIDFHNTLVPFFCECADNCVKILDDYTNEQLSSSDCNYLKLASLAEAYKNLKINAKQPYAKDMISALRNIKEINSEKNTLLFIDVAEKLEQVLHDCVGKDKMAECTTLFEARFREILSIYTVKLIEGFKKILDDELKCENIELKKKLKEREALENKNKKHFGAEAWDYIKNNKGAIALALVSVASMALSIFVPPLMVATAAVEVGVYGTIMSFLSKIRF